LEHFEIAKIDTRAQFSKARPYNRKARRVRRRAFDVLRICELELHPIPVYVLLRGPDVIANMISVYVPFPAHTRQSGETKQSEPAEVEITISVCRAAHIGSSFGHVRIRRRWSWLSKQWKHRKSCQHRSGLCEF
jgi:hypothetical protein